MGEGKREEEREGGREEERERGREEEGGGGERRGEGGGERREMIQRVLGPDLPDSGSADRIG